MEKSKPYQKVISLGKKIAAEFSNDGRNETTTSWMGYYLSELIDEIDNEKSLPKKRKLQKECSKIIEELWKKKAIFPANVRPLGNLEDVISIIEALTDKEIDQSKLIWTMYGRTEDFTPWGEFIFKIRTSMEKILAISLNSAITEEALKKEKEWLEHPEMLTELEKEALEKLESLLIKNDHNPLIRFINTTHSDTIPEKSTDKLTQVINKLREIIEEEMKSLDNLNKEINKKNE